MSDGGAKFCTLFMDDCNEFLINQFLEQKLDLAKKGTHILKRLKDQHGIKNRTIRYDNAGENIKMEEVCIYQRQK